MLDLILKGGTIFDGSGGGGFPGDVGIEGDRIAQVGKLDDAQAVRVIDCRGFSVAPGFVDMHSHSDLTLFVEPEASAKIRQGVTLELLGQDGLSVAPISERNLPEIKSQLAGLLTDPPIPWRWRRVKDYLNALDRKTAINVAYLVPHSALRWEVVGFEGRPATTKEIEAMAALLKESLQEGAVGLSTGLVYPPNCYAEKEEMLALARATAEEGGIFVVHIRNEADYAVEAIEEMIEIGRKTGCPIHISHLKVSGRENWWKMDRLIERLEEARAKGLDLTCDLYPYTAGCTILSGLLPPWAHEGGPSKTLTLLKDPKARAKMRSEMETPGPCRWENRVRNAGYEGIMISSVKSDANRRFLGKSLAQIAEEWGTDPAEAAFDILVEEELHVTMIIFGQSEANVEKAMRCSFQMFGTDGVPGKRPHPRLYGTFPRALGLYVREKRLLSLHEAIRKMSFLPVKRLGLSDQGLVKEGMRANLTIFDPDRVIDRATYEEPTRYPEGIDSVIVNGVVVVERGVQQDTLPGRVIRHGDS